MNADHDFHGTDDQLEQYALGRLPDSDLPSLEEHLMICSVCQDRLDGIGDFALGMREALATNRASRAAGFAWLPQIGKMAWFQRPAVSMGLVFVTLVAVIGLFSHARVKTSAAVSLQLTAMRGDMPVTSPAREFDLTLTDGPRDGGPFRIEVVDATGSAMWTALAASEPSGMQVKVLRPLQQGDYFVRIYEASGRMLREYGFRIRA